MVRELAAPPEPMSTLRVGGSTAPVTMQAPPEYGGFQIHNLWTYSAIIEPSRIEFVSRFADADGNPIEPGRCRHSAGRAE